MKAHDIVAAQGYVLRRIVLSGPLADEDQNVPRAAGPRHAAGFGGQCALRGAGAQLFDEALHGGFGQRPQFEFLPHLQGAFDGAHAVHQIVRDHEFRFRHRLAQLLHDAGAQNELVARHAHAGAPETAGAALRRHARRDVHVAPRVGNPAPGRDALGDGMGAEREEGLGLPRNEDQAVMAPDVKVGEIAEVAAPRPPMPFAGDEEAVQAGGLHGRAHARQTVVPFG